MTALSDQARTRSRTARSASVSCSSKRYRSVNRAGGEPITGGGGGEMTVIVVFLSLDPADVPGPFLLAQFELLDLPAARTGQRRHELNRLGRLETGDVFPYVRDQLRLTDLAGVRGENDERLGALAPLLVGYADHRRFVDGGVRFEGVLHLDGRDVLTAGDDDVLGPVPQFHIAVGVHDTQVAGVHPATL